MTTYQVGYLIGSLATQSINRKLAKALVRLAPHSLQFSEISFRDLPLYSYDYDNDYPEAARKFKAAIKASRQSASAAMQATNPQIIQQAMDDMTARINGQKPTKKLKE